MHSSLIFDLRDFFGYDFGSTVPYWLLCLKIEKNVHLLNMIVIKMTLTKEEWIFQRRYRQMQGQVQGHQTLYIQATK